MAKSTKTDGKFPKRCGFYAALLLLLVRRNEYPEHS